MKYEATLRQIFVEPPAKLLEIAFGEAIVIKRSLSTDFIQVEDAHPDLLFETIDGRILHVELHGYAFRDFPVRNLLYYAIITRDHRRPPEQAVFWYGGGRPKIASGLRDPRHLDYRYPVINIADIDADLLLEGNPSDAVFAILCRTNNGARTVAGIFQRIRQMPIEKRADAVTQVLILSGLTRLAPLVRKEVKRMPLVFDIQENTFLQGIYKDGAKKGRKEGREEGLEQSRLQARAVLADLLTEKFGPLPKALQRKLDAAKLDTLYAWQRRVLRAKTAEEVVA